MAIRTLFVVGLLVLASGLGCVGMSGQCYYEATSASAGHELGEIVDDCPTCPSGHRGRDAIVHAAPAAAHDDGVIPPHAKFHPVPTHPVFAPKVAMASATLELAPAVPAAAPTLAASNGDDAPAPPTLVAAKQKPSSRSVLKPNEPKVRAETTIASVLVARKDAPPATIEHTAATPVPAPVANAAAISEPTPAAKPATGDGWRPRVAN